MSWHQGDHPELLLPLEIPSSCRERVNIDFVTKLPTTPRNHDMIVTIIDSLTKRVHRFTIKEANLTAACFAGLFIEYYVRAHGIPVSIVSDRDVQFTSAF
jgi:bifunctional DNase/RNase